MPITINGDGSITGLSVGGLGSGVVNTATLADGAATGVKQGAGSVIQVLQSVITDVENTTSASFAAIPGLSVNITPSATSSKILVTVDLKLGNNSGAGAYIKLVRNGNTDIYVGDTATDRTPCLHQTYGGGDTGEGLYGMAKMGGTFLDSPNTTSQVTYAVYWMRMNTATLYTNRCGSETHTQYEGRAASSITVMEIKQ
tara:strand:- start:42 stop:638 length:597 start_codon:yes stop_codon:yes gene_type:complete